MAAGIVTSLAYTPSNIPRLVACGVVAHLAVAVNMTPRDDGDTADALALLVLQLVKHPVGLPSVLSPRGIGCAVTLSGFQSACDSAILALCYATAASPQQSGTMFHQQRGIEHVAAVPRYGSTMGKLALASCLAQYAVLVPQSLGSPAAFDVLLPLLQWSTQRPRGPDIGAFLHQLAVALWAHCTKAGLLVEPPRSSALSNEEVEEVLRAKALAKLGAAFAFASSSNEAVRCCGMGALAHMCTDAAVADEIYRSGTLVEVAKAVRSAAVGSRHAEAALATLCAMVVAGGPDLAADAANFAKPRLFETVQAYVQRHPLDLVRAPLTLHYSLCTSVRMLHALGFGNDSTMVSTARSLRFADPLLLPYTATSVWLLARSPEGRAALGAAGAVDLLVSWMVLLAQCSKSLGPVASTGAWADCLEADTLIASDDHPAVLRAKRARERQEAVDAARRARMAEHNARREAAALKRIMQRSPMARTPNSRAAQRERRRRRKVQTLTKIHEDGAAEPEAGDAEAKPVDEAEAKEGENEATATFVTEPPAPPPPGLPLAKLAEPVHQRVAATRADAADLLAYVAGAQWLLLYNASNAASFEDAGGFLLLIDLLQAGSQEVYIAIHMALASLWTALDQLTPAGRPAPTFMREKPKLLDAPSVLAGAVAGVVRCIRHTGLPTDTRLLASNLLHRICTQYDDAIDVASPMGGTTRGTNRASHTSNNNSMRSNQSRISNQGHGRGYSFDLFKASSGGGAPSAAGGPSPTAQTGSGEGVVAGDVQPLFGNPPTVVIAPMTASFGHVPGYGSDEEEGASPDSEERFHWLPYAVSLKAALSAAVGGGEQFPRLLLLTELLRCPDAGAHEHAASMLARLADSTAEKSAVARLGGVKNLSLLITTSNQPRVVEHAMHALLNLTTAPDCQDSCGEHAMDALLAFARSTAYPTLQTFATQIMANITVRHVAPVACCGDGRGGMPLDTRVCMCATEARQQPYSIVSSGAAPQSG